MTSFRAPDPECTTDLDAHIALLPKNARVTGFFFRDMLERASRVRARETLFEHLAIPARTYVPFLDYPCDDWFRLKLGTARLLFPDVGPALALRHLGHSAFDAFQSSTFGRVMFQTTLGDPVRALTLASRAYRFIANFGSIRTEVLGPTHARIHYSAFPAYLESYQVGIVEGTLRTFRAVPQVLIATDGLERAVLDVSWHR